MQTPPKVAILLCTYHGQHHLAEQLESFATQCHTQWEVFASDDGSQDGTHSVLESYRARWGSGRLSLHFGPAEGFVANFLSLTCNANIQAKYYAYSDQDDIWEPDKLQRAVAWLEQVDQDTPALYCTRTRLVDAANQEMGLSPLFERPPSFSNALAQNIGGGNSMVFNEAARQLLKRAGDDVDVVSHDWWLYLVVTGCGGVVCYDPYPSLRYRQHDANLIGMNAGWRARWQRILMLLKGRFKEWNALHIAALERTHEKLTPASQRILSEFSTARQAGLIRRLIGMKRSGIHRQTLGGNVGLFFAILANKL
jgi:glycosyltransferase involved in cell wall biosynthesis